MNKATALALILMALAIGVAINTATADIFYLNWMKPVERTDGTPLLPEEIKNYEMIINGTPVDELINGAAQEFALDLPAPGNYQVELKTIDTEGRTSKSLFFKPMEVLKPVTPPKPPSTGTWVRKTQ